MDMEGEEPTEDTSMQHSPSRPVVRSEPGYFEFSPRSTMFMTIGCAVLVVGIAWTAFAILIKVAIGAYGLE